MLVLFTSALQSSNVFNNAFARTSWEASHRSFVVLRPSMASRRCSSRSSALRRRSETIRCGPAAGPPGTPSGKGGASYNPTGEHPGRGFDLPPFSSRCSFSVRREHNKLGLGPTADCTGRHCRAWLVLSTIYVLRDLRHPLTSVKGVQGTPCFHSPPAPEVDNARWWWLWWWR